MYKKNLIQLMLGKGVGDVCIKKILRYMESHSQTTFEEFCTNEDLFCDVTRCTQTVFASVVSQSEKAEKLFCQLEKEGVYILLETDREYPCKLKKTLDKHCPPVLFVKGNLELLSTVSVGFCGSRKVSTKGIVITEQCAEQLIGQHMTVVSGYASGTDISAHVAAMSSGGNTIFVLAEGILNYKEKTLVKPYLSSSNHVFVSQFVPDALWNVGNAMKRNSIIIGLSDAMILVESGRTGGTFAAGNESLNKGVPLFVIDYLKPEVSAEANPYFIQRGGHPIRGINGVPNLEKVFSAVKKYNKSSEYLEQLRMSL